MSIEQVLKEKYGLELPSLPAAGGIYSISSRVGNLLFVAGQVSSLNGELRTGTVGADCTLEDGQEAAKCSALNILAIIKNELGDLDKVKKFVQLIGYVQCTADFKDHPKVINGASELIHDLYGDRGLPTRLAIGTNALPLNATTEILAIVECE